MSLWGHQDSTALCSLVGAELTKPGNQEQEEGDFRLKRKNQEEVKINNQK